MTVIAFATLVVVTDNTLASTNVNEPVFVSVGTIGLRMWQLPDNFFRNRPARQFLFIAIDQARLHVGIIANIVAGVKLCAAMRRNALRLLSPIG